MQYFECTSFQVIVVNWAGQFLSFRHMAYVSIILEALRIIEEVIHQRRWYWVLLAIKNDYGHEGSSFSINCGFYSNIKTYIQGKSFTISFYGKKNKPQIQSVLQSVQTEVLSAFQLFRIPQMQKSIVFTRILEGDQSIAKKVKNRLQGYDMARNISYSF